MSARYFFATESACSVGCNKVWLHMSQQWYFWKGCRWFNSNAWPACHACRWLDAINERMQCGCTGMYYVSPELYCLKNVVYSWHSHSCTLVLFPCPARDCLSFSWFSHYHDMAFPYFSNSSELGCRNLPFFRWREWLMVNRHKELFQTLH